MTASTLNQSPVIVQTFMGAFYLNGTAYYAADTGTANAAVIPVTASPASYLSAVGTVFSTIAKATNTSSSMTAKIGSLAAVNVVLNDGVATPKAGQYISGQYYQFTPTSDGTKLILLNPSDGVGSATLGITGTTGSPTTTLGYSVGADGWYADVTLTAGNGTSNVGNCTLTGVPSILTAATIGNNIIAPVLNNSAAVWGGYSAFNTTTWILNNQNVGGGNFASTGLKGIPTGGVQFRISLR